MFVSEDEDVGQPSHHGAFPFLSRIILCAQLYFAFFGEEEVSQRPSADMVSHTWKGTSLSGTHAILKK